MSDHLLSRGIYIVVSIVGVNNILPKLIHVIFGVLMIIQL